MGNNIGELISAARAALMLSVCPFIGSLLMRCEVKLTETVPTAAVDKGKTIYINPEWASGLGKKGLLTVMAHEALHLAFRHGQRAEAVEDKFVYNIAADAVVNYVLEQHGIALLPGSVTMEAVGHVVGVYYRDLEKLSTEALYKLLLDKLPKGKPRPGGVGEDLKPELGGEAEEGEGKGEEKVSKEDWDSYWRDAINRAYVTARMAGRAPVGLERFFEVLKPRVDWRSVLRETLITGMGMKAVSTYLRPSRKHPELPGLRRFVIPTIWVLADLSGSIGDEQASQFAGEVFAVAKTFNTTVKVIPWDTQPYEMTVLRSPSEIGKLRFRGGGGTEIRSTLEKVLKEMSLYDSVIILTDGFIGDIERAEVQGMLDKIAYKASSAVFVTTANKPKLPGKWTVVEMV
jgi:predicted metal-dependent peptidase